MDTISKTQVIERLKLSGYKITKPRLLVLSFLASAKKPVSAKEISKNLKGKLDQVTVYRILEVFKKDGVVVQIDFQDGVAYFELKDLKKDHHHIICTKCKKVKDFTGCQSKRVIDGALKNVSGFAEITNHSFELFGVCKSCAVN